MRRDARGLFWRALAAGVALGLALRALDAWIAGPGAATGGGDVVLFGFWAAIGRFFANLFSSQETGGAPTLGGQQFRTNSLFSAMNSAYEAVKDIGRALVEGLSKVWDFLKVVWTDVIKPLWKKLWEWYDVARKWLEDVFRPIFQYLAKLRKWFNAFYTKWVRPILDAIDVARKILRVLEVLGVDWAKKLDADLAELQRRIDAPFRLVLAKINEIVNLVNRIVTLDGLVQRLALVRSIERDIREVRRAISNWGSTPLTDAEYHARRVAELVAMGYDEASARGIASARLAERARTEADIWREFTATVEPGGAAQDPHAAEIAAVWRQAIRPR